MCFSCFYFPLICQKHPFVSGGVRIVATGTQRVCIQLWTTGIEYLRLELWNPEFIQRKRVFKFLATHYIATHLWRVRPWRQDEPGPEWAQSTSGDTFLLHEGQRAGQERHGGRQAVSLEHEILRRDLEEWEAKPEGDSFISPAILNSRKEMMIQHILQHHWSFIRTNWAERLDLKLSRLHSACWLQGLA